MEARKNVKMRFAYADPPYLGCARKLYGELHPNAADYDDPATHQRLIDRLCDEFPDGWALSLHTPSLRTILPMTPEDCRVMAWVKPFAVFKANVTIAYAWEPIIVRGGRPRPRTMPTIRDWVSEVITLKKGCPGAKPERFCLWLFDVLNMQPDDEFTDIFPGSGLVTSAWNNFRRQGVFSFEATTPDNEANAQTTMFETGQVDADRESRNDGKSPRRTKHRNSCV